MKSATRPFTLIELLIVVVIISFIVEVPVRVFASPVMPARNDAAIIQVKDSLRQIAEAATLWEKAGGCSMWDCMAVDKLVAAGKLADAPQVPSGIGVDGTSPVYSSTAKPMGGCGPGNVGAPVTTNPALKNVSEQFCRDYNNSVGLGNTIVENCQSGGDCAASGSTDPYDFPMVKSSSFCYRRLDTFAVVWMASSRSNPCPKK